MPQRGLTDITIRWGQAVAVINDVLFVHGGRTDESNLYSYDSAPTNNDVLYLPLSSPFDPASPPWLLISDSSSSPPGPAVAWHTLSASNATHLFVFGGDPGPNSPVVLPSMPDSISLYHVATSTPGWIPVPQGWAGQPIRRIHHTASYANGKVYIVGGLRADGSGMGFPDHYVFDPSVPSFSVLPSQGGPDQLFGHASVVTPDGLLLVFGGYVPGSPSLVPLNTIWSLDTKQSTPRWTVLHTTGTDVPGGRRAFAAVALRDGRILIHGGADAVFENTFSDAWILDLSTRQWSHMDALEQTLGPRRDHFAVTVGNYVIFGFGELSITARSIHDTCSTVTGYGMNGPLASTLSVFDISTGTSDATYVPPSEFPSPTLPPFASTPIPSSPTSGRQTNASPSRSPATTSPLPSPSGSNSASGASKNTTGIAVGSVLAVLAVLTCAFVAGYYMRRKAAGDPPGTERKFHPLDGPSGDEESHLNRNIPVAGVDRDPQAGGWLVRKPTQVLNALGIGGLGRSATKRRDMLADEDTRDFEHKRDWTNGSTWTVLSMFGSGGSGAMGRGRSSREGSLRAGTPLREKDPFDDNAAMALMDEPSYGAATAPRHRRGGHEAGPSRSSGSAPGYGHHRGSYTSTAYSDPFEDLPVEETVFDLNAYSDGGHGEAPPVVPAKPDAARRLSPLVELTSQHTQSDPTDSVSTHDDTPVDLTHIPSHENVARSIRPASSIFDSPPTQPIRRSDSWWSRLGFLDRRSSDAGRYAARIDFRDPNPPPRLSVIRESFTDRESSYPPPSADSRGARGGLVHGRSISSIRTSRTADSEVIERIGGLEVVQRAETMTSSGHHDPPPGSGRLKMVHPSGSMDDGGQLYDMGPPIELMEQPQSQGAWSTIQPSSPTPTAVSSNIVRDLEEAASVESSGTPTSASGSNVMTGEPWEYGPAQARRTSVKYGLAPKRPLFVANPDHTQMRSSDS
jgi:hypothetical protein